jgi:hypothetical protein
METVMPQNSRFVKKPPALRLRDPNDVLFPSYGDRKSFMGLLRIIA